MTNNNSYIKNVPLSLFDFNLPKEQIAQYPLEDKSKTKMLYVSNNAYKDENIKDILKHISKNDVLVFNNTKVIPAKIIAYKNKAKLVITLHYKVSKTRWLTFIKNSKKIQEGDTIIFYDEFFAKVIEKKDYGETLIEFQDENYMNMVHKYGSMPLPPYIKRTDEELQKDKKSYQSIFAKKEGAVAAPTASFHFTDELMEEIKQIGCKVVFVTLHVGAGTFLPVREENIYNHKMHKEYGEISQDVCNVITDSKKNGGKVLAIGTTAMRVLEYVGKINNGKLSAFKGEIDLYITPGFKFTVVDNLLTNFHLPKSTLFMLVSAFCKLDTMKKAYAHAVKQNYRFFSYGDCCFLQNHNIDNSKKGIKVCH